MNRKLLLNLVLLTCFFGFLGLAPSFASSVEGGLLESERRRIAIYQNVVPSVVNVSNITISRDRFFGIPHEQEAGAGSGFVWDEEGHIVTNFHVVSNRKAQFMVTFHNDKKQYKATVVGEEPKLDVAVLKVEKLPKHIRPVKIGKSAPLKVGQMAIAIGNPFGLDLTMTSGIISALGRKMDGVGGVKIHDMIQTDADINPGNSGGPLLNSSGQLIGMNTMIYSRSGSSAGLGFAVPVDSISEVVPQLIKHGKVIRPYLGITPLPDQYRDRMVFGQKGVVVATVIENGPADRAGLKGMRRDRWGRMYIGDTILEIEGKEVNSLDDIFQTLKKYKIGDKVKVLVRTDNQKKKTVKVKLDSL
jgi:S1-C subfamily serine protease